MLKDLFATQQQYINDFFDRIDIVAAERLLQRLLECKGLIFFTGIGKSALVAKKIAMTMTSTGSRSLFLSPTNALHGDIGIVSQEDLFIIFSKSGESDELLNLIPALRNKGVAITSIVCKEHSRLSELSDDTILLPLEKELGPHNLTPTTSALIQMAFGDILAIALMMKKNFHLEEYQLNHPSGRIGKRMLLKVEDLMLTGDKLPLCHPEEPLVNSLVELSNKQAGCLLVIDKQNHLLGIFTDGDLRRALQKIGPDALHMPIKELMTHSARYVHPKLLAVKALEMMEENQKSPISILPVLDERTDTLIGLIKLHDILQSGI